MKGVSLRRGVYWFRGRIDGRLIQFSCKTSREPAAIEYAERRIKEGYVERKPNPLPWEVSVERFLEHRRRQHHSEQTLTRDRFVWMATGWEDARSVTTAAVLRWLDRQKNPRTRVDYLDRLTRLFRWLKISPNPCDGIERPVARLVPKAVRRRFLSRAEAERLLKTPCDDGLKFALYCALHAGLRKGEVMAARPGWFDLKAGLLHVTADATWRAKDRDDRTIPLSAQFKKFLKGYGLREPFMLRPEKKRGKHVHRVELRKPFADHLKACKISGVTFHDLRRTFASLQVSAGTPVYLCAKWMGDSIAVVERHYGHLQKPAGEIDKPWRKSK